MPELRRIIVSTALIAVFLVLAAPSGAVAASDTTLADLQAALEGESNAAARYAAFASRASDEGYPGVASLFRAAAKAEQVHAENHARVIRELGGIPAVQVAVPIAGSTRENLRAAIEGESYERDTMYPEFLARAKQAGESGAVRTLNLARNAEIEHAKLYREALESLDQRAPEQTYYVCTVCGYTVRKVEGNKCRSCFESVDNYVAVR